MLQKHPQQFDGVVLLRHQPPKPLNDAQNWVVYFYPSMSIQFDTNVVRIILIINGMASWFMHNTSNISMEITDTSRIVINCIISTKNTIFILHLTPKNQLFTVLYSSILYIWIFTLYNYHICTMALVTIWQSDEINLEEVKWFR